jgi:hypothetical protein
MSGLKALPLQQPSSANKRQRLQPPAQSLKAFEASDDEEGDVQAHARASAGISADLQKELAELQVCHVHPPGGALPCLGVPNCCVVCLLQHLISLLSAACLQTAGCAAAEAGELAQALELFDKALSVIGKEVRSDRDLIQLKMHEVYEAKAQVLLEQGGREFEAIKV